MVYHNCREPAIAVWGWWSDPQSGGFQGHGPFQAILNVARRFFHLVWSSIIIEHSHPERLDRCRARVRGSDDVSRWFRVWRWPAYGMLPAASTPLAAGGNNCLCAPQISTQSSNLLGFCFLNTNILLALCFGNHPIPFSNVTSCNPRQLLHYRETLKVAVCSIRRSGPSTCWSQTRLATWFCWNGSHLSTQHDSCFRDCDQSGESGSESHVHCHHWGWTADKLYTELLD